MIYRKRPQPANKPSPKPGNKKSVFVASAVAAMMMSTSAYALDATGLIERYQKVAADNGVKIEYGAVENPTNSSFTLKDITITPKSGNPLKAGSFTVEGAKELADGGLGFSFMEVTNIAASDDDVTFTIGSIAANDVNIPADYYADPLASINLYSRIGIDNIKVQNKGKEVFSVSSLGATIDKPADENGILKSKSTLEGLFVDVKSIEEPAFQQQMAALGYDKISGNMIADGEWNLATGHINIPKFDINLDEIGTLSMTTKIGGYTKELLGRINKLTQEAQNSGNPQAASMMMLNEMSNLSFEAMTFSFTDASVTNRVLTMQAKQMGGKPSDLAKMVPTMMPMMMAGLNAPDFTKQATDAVGAFLASPKNITISATPAEAVPFGEIMGAGTAAPQTLIQLLNVGVSANQ